jgi:hypothetical protein
VRIRTTGTLAAKTKKALAEARAFLVKLLSELGTTLTSGLRQRDADLAENGADASGNVRHDRASGNGYKASHQCVFDKVLPLGFLDNPQIPDQAFDGFHFVFYLLSM